MDRSEPASHSAKGKEPASEQQHPTTPPRMSFGVELEFLIAQPSAVHAEETEMKSDPDHAWSHLLPPLGPPYSGVDAMLLKVKQVLTDEGIPTNRVTYYGDKGSRKNPLNAWTIDSDGSVRERGDDSYDWVPIELISPASYAFDEAFDMIRLIISIVTTNFRCRVNTTCGLHVHVGNGPQRMTLRAARNFAALWWAAEPLLSMLHPPERGVGEYAKSSRRVWSSKISKGQGAEDVRVSKEGYARSEKARREYRFFGRDRKLGEETEAVRVLRTDGEFFCEDPGDDSDWETEESRPFRRPKKEPPIVLEGEPKVVEPLQFEHEVGPSVKRGPPEIFYPAPGGDGKPPTGWDGQVEDESWRYLPRPGPSPMARLGGSKITRTSSHRPLEALQDPSVLRRMVQNDAVMALKVLKHPENTQPERSGPSAGWSGVKELLSCDAGLHQLEALLSSAESVKYTNLRWSAYRTSSLKPRVGSGSLYSDPSFRIEHPDSMITDTPWIRPLVTVESREALGSLDGAWVAAWARIVCRVAEFARDAEAGQLMRVIGLCCAATARDESGGGEAEYDVVDLLNDIGLPREARLCEERLARGSEGMFECRLLRTEEGDRAWTVLQGLEEEEEKKDGDEGSSLKSFEELKYDFNLMH